jgi:retron-type reverse transcriptase
VEDKIVQMGIKKILEAIFEVDFRDVSYGFRPKRDCCQALNMLDKVIMTKQVYSRNTRFTEKISDKREDRIQGPK